MLSNSCNESLPLSLAMCALLLKAVQSASSGPELLCKGAAHPLNRCILSLSLLKALLKLLTIWLAVRCVKLALGAA